jgi:ribosome-binding protein aMBF1 (putative translation factor)
MTKIKDLHKAWMRDAAYRREYDALEEEFTVMAAIAKARRRAGLSQAELARRMKTTQQS